MSQVVLITGCSRGLGKLLAERLASRGFIVYAGIRKAEDVKRLSSLWQETKVAITPLKLDVTLDQSCCPAVRKIIAEKKRIDILINNAAYALAGPTECFSSDQFLELLNINVVGPFRLIREVIPQMRNQKSGRIINITSLNGLLALPNFGLYSASKFALEALGFSLRCELKGAGILVTNIEPGAIASPTPLTKKMPHLPAREKFWLLKLLMPMVTQEQVAEVIEKVVDNPHPPVRVILGRDAQITTFLQRFLPQKIWDFLLSFVWQG